MSCSEAAVQDAIDLAASGDTVAVPAGECTWPSGVLIPASKGITLAGGVGGRTTITGRLDLHANAAASSRVTGFTFATGDLEGAIVTAGSAASAPFRIDHNLFTHDGGTELTTNGDSIDLYEEDSGYPALYQIGRGRDQVLDPAYVWGNDPFFSVGSQTPDMVQAGRDYSLAERPDYAPFPYPYPLDASGLPSP